PRVGRRPARALRRGLPGRGGAVAALAGRGGAVAGGRAVSGVPPLATRADALPGAVYSRLAERLAAFPGETYPFHVGDTFLLPPDGCRTDQVAHDRHPDLNRYTPVPGHP